MLEACVKGCGEPFHVEVGRFKFLNEMIKLVSPRYLASRTPQHIQKKVIEMLFLWTKELKSETKIVEAYDMLKKQGIITKDPDYVGSSVFAASLPPRPESPLSKEKSQQLKLLLQSKNPDDLQKANKIIKELVKEDERKMDALTKRSTEIVMVNNNSKLLNEMLDHYDKLSSGPEELELFKELFESCEKMQPKLFRLAAETDEGDETIAEILHASDDLSRVIDRYKMVIVQGKPDVLRPLVKQDSEKLLEVSPSQSASIPKEDNSLLGLEDLLIGNPTSNSVSVPEVDPVPTQASAITLPVSQPSIDDLLNGSISGDVETPSLLVNSGLMANLNASGSGLKTPFDLKMEEKKNSRQKGLEELDFLGETLIKSQLSGTARSPQFEKRNEKLSMNQLQEKRKETDLTHTLPPHVGNSTPKPGMASKVVAPPKVEDIINNGDFDEHHGDVIIEAEDIIPPTFEFGDEDDGSGGGKGKGNQPGDQADKLRFTYSFNKFMKMVSI